VLRQRQLAGAGVSTDVKEHTAAFAVALQARGVPLETLISALKERTLALRGAKQKKIARATPQYTNQQLSRSSEFGKGVELLPLMFTYDPTFDPTLARGGPKLVPGKRDPP
jgi:hypothetical protein